MGGEITPRHHDRRHQAPGVVPRRGCISLPGDRNRASGNTVCSTASSVLAVVRDIAAHPQPRSAAPSWPRARLPCAPLPAVWRAVPRSPPASPSRYCPPCLEFGWRKTESEWRDLARAASLSPARAGGGIARNAGAGGDGRDESRLCAGGPSPRACCPTKASRPRIRSAVGPMELPQSTAKVGPDPPWWGVGVHWTGAVLLWGASTVICLRVKIEEATEQNLPARWYWDAASQASFDFLPLFFLFFQRKKLYELASTTLGLCLETPHRLAAFAQRIR
jgi:hypothetical protein